MSEYLKDGKFFPIPKARFYVLSNDRFMSGWGPAKGIINTCVIPCDDMGTAERVEAYAQSRGDQTHVRIIVGKPRTRKGVLYSLLTDWIETSAK